MHTISKRPSSDSPSKFSSPNVPGGNSTPKRFKTPMSFTPREAPSPSRTELWKRELGLEDIEVDSEDGSSSNSSDEDEPEVDQNGNRKGHHTKVEIEALELELERKEKQKEEMLARLRESADKVKTYRRELERAQEAKRNQLKIMKKTYESHLKEKEETIQSLHEIIEEQDSKIVELHSKLIGESSSDENSEISVYRSVKKLVDKLSHLQHEKANLTSSLMKTQERMGKIEEENEGKLSKLEEEKKQIESEKRKLEKEMRDLKILMDSGEPTLEKKETIEKLEKENRILLNNLSDVENELNDHKKKNLEWEHRFEHEVSSLRNSIRQTEAKYSQAAATPPKVVVKTVIPEEYIQKCEELKTANRTLESELAVLQEKHKLQVSSLQEKLGIMKEENSMYSEQSRRSYLENEKLTEELKLKAEIETLLKKKSEACESLNAELRKSAEMCQNLQTESTSKLAALRHEMKLKVEETRVKTEKKYANMIKNYNETKRRTSELETVSISLKNEVKKLKAEMGAMVAMIKPTVKETEKAICRAIDDIDSRSKILTERYRRELKLRKKYFNELIELKGNIRVHCRVRPTIKEDGTGDQSQIVTDYDLEDDGVIYVEHRGNTKAFEVDKVFRPDSTQEEVFNEVQSIITSCIDGYNVCIFAYGQTGSGKTFTMEGTPANPGINPRALRFLFGEVADRVDWEYSLSVSLMEIYNEALRDLLNTSPGAPLEIKQGKDGVFVPGLQEVVVKNVEDVNEVFALGHKNRATASTSMNEYSSRSHAILQINIVGKNKNTGTQSFGKLNLVDLAGSERVSKSGAEGARMKEAQNINKSLSSLGDVIQSLKMKNSHIPYRNSKLTYLLQNSLGGDSKTLMVVQVAPVKKNAGETFCSLDFASRVRNVELGQATKKIESVDSSMRSDTPKSRTPKKRT